MSVVLKLEVVSIQSLYCKMASGNPDLYTAVPYYLCGYIFFFATEGMFPYEM